MEWKTEMAPVCTQNGKVASTPSLGCGERKVRNEKNLLVFLGVWKRILDMMGTRAFVARNERKKKKGLAPPANPASEGRQEKAKHDPESSA